MNCIKGVKSLILNRENPGLSSVNQPGKNKMQALKNASQGYQVLPERGLPQT